jgi:glycosyltransferase involved in cell wall biosynthesis
LRTLIGDPALRERMGQAGRRRVEKEFSVQANEKKLANCLIESQGGQI